MSFIKWIYRKFANLYEQRAGEEAMRTVKYMGVGGSGGQPGMSFHDFVLAFAAYIEPDEESLQLLGELDIEQLKEDFLNFENELLDVWLSKELDAWP